MFLAHKNNSNSNNLLLSENIWNTFTRRLFLSQHTKYTQTEPYSCLIRCRGMSKSSRSVEQQQQLEIDSETSHTQQNTQNICKLSNLQKKIHSFLWSSWEVKPCWMKFILCDHNPEIVLENYGDPKGPWRKQWLICALNLIICSLDLIHAHVILSSSVHLRYGSLGCNKVLFGSWTKICGYNSASGLWLWMHFLAITDVKGEMSFFSRSSNMRLTECIWRPLQAKQLDRKNY